MTPSATGATTTMAAAPLSCQRAAGVLSAVTRPEFAGRKTDDWQGNIHLHVTGMGTP